MIFTVLVVGGAGAGGFFFHKRLYTRSDSCSANDRPAIYGALATTSQYPGHPDQGMAKAAQIISWIGIGLFILLMLFYGGIFAAVLMSGG